MTALTRRRMASVAVVSRGRMNAGMRDPITLGGMGSYSFVVRCPWSFL
jgi:hypothetical protein